MSLKKNKHIYLQRPILGSYENRLVADCIKRNWVNSGKYIELFENKIKKFTKSKHAIACINGTSALQVSLRLCEVGMGDEVMVPSLTFIAPINAVQYNGASPIFIDCDEHHNLDDQKAMEFISKNTFYDGKFSINKKTRKKIKAIILVHMWGNAVRLEKLIKLCKKRNISVVEDASESLGTTYLKGIFKRKHTGIIGKFGCLSFNSNKIITSCTGGMILTQNSKLAKKARYLISQAKDNQVYYIHNNVGYNFTLSNIHAAVGYAQMKYLKKRLEKKTKIHQWYQKEIKNIKGLKLILGPKYSKNSYWFNILEVNSKKFKMSRNNLIDFLSRNNVETRAVWLANHQQKPYKKSQAYKVVKSGKYANNSLCLPSGVDLNFSNIKFITNLLKKCE